jgi:cell division protein FtsB
MISQIGIKYKLHQIKNQMKYLESQTQDAQDQIEELTTNKSSLEKFAREQYRMKRENEEIFVVVPEKD